jgi:NitT/TauT family transport system substrate-binding protein
MRRMQVGLAPLLVACAMNAASAENAATTPEQKKIALAVGGKSALFYLPLTLAERLGYFKEQGLEVEISDFAGGSKALQALMGGSADVVSGGIDHTIIMHAKGQKITAFVLQLVTPAISMVVRKDRLASYKGPASLKGMTIGVTAPGSSTHVFLNHLLGLGQLGPDDVSVIGVGTGPAAAAALRNSQIDALVNIEPAVTLVERMGVAQSVVETVTVKGATAVFGGLLPAGCLYTKPDFIHKNPNTVRALTLAMVRALKWLQKASPEDIAKAVPEEYLVGDRALYFAALQKSRESYSRDGLIPAAGMENLHRVLKAHDPLVAAASTLNLAETYDNRFVQQALQLLK